MKGAPSSQKYHSSFTILIVDFDNQVMTLDSKSLIKIKPIKSTNLILEKSSVKVEGGVAVFDSINFFGPPESTKNLFSLTSKAIETEKIKSVYGEEFYE